MNSSLISRSALETAMNFLQVEHPTPPYSLGWAQQQGTWLWHHHQQLGGRVYFKPTGPRCGRHPGAILCSPHSSYDTLVWKIPCPSISYQLLAFHVPPQGKAPPTWDLLWPKWSNCPKASFGRNGRLRLCKDHSRRWTCNPNEHGPDICCSWEQKQTDGKKVLCSTILNSWKGSLAVIKPDC